MAASVRRRALDVPSRADATEAPAAAGWAGNRNAHHGVPGWPGRHQPVPRLRSGSSPCPRPARTRMLLIAKTGAHACLHLKQAPEEPDEIRKAVQISQHIGRDLSPGFDETHDSALSA